MTIPSETKHPTQPQAPAWAKWLAQDADGTWWGYSVEPLEHHNGWYENEVGQYINLGKASPNPDWRNSLKRV